MELLSDWDKSKFRGLMGKSLIWMGIERMRGEEDRKCKQLVEVLLFRRRAESTGEVDSK